MKVFAVGSGTATRVNEALDEIHSHWPITTLGVRDPESPAAAWARRRSIPVLDYLPPCVIDLGVVLPTGDSSVEAWHARMLMDNVPCMEIHP